MIIYVSSLTKYFLAAVISSIFMIVTLEILVGISIVGYVVIFVINVLVMLMEYSDSRR